MKNKSFLSFSLLWMTFLVIAGCNDESALREPINLDGLRVVSIEQMKDLSAGSVNFKVTVPSVVMSAPDNYDSGVLVIQDGDDPRSGIRVRGAGVSYAFGDQVLLDLNGVGIETSDLMHTIVLPDAAHLKTQGGNQPFSALPATLAQFHSGNLQSMYVSLDGFQCIEEALDTPFSGIVRFQNVGKDTIAVYVNPSSPFASGKVPAGSGMLKGVVKFQDGEWMLLPQRAEDFALTKERFRVKTQSNAVVVWSEGADLGRYVAEVSTNEMDGAISLDAGGAQCANSYVVSAPGIYSFHAKNAVGNWPAGIPEGTVLYLNVAALGGNAVIAYVNPDTDAILWTWHIWASEASLGQMSVVKKSLAEDGSEREITMLDRLLGATSTKAGNPKASGLYYQWGRKDAFPGPNMLGSWADDKEAESEAILGGEATAVTSVNVDLVPDWNVAEEVMPTSQIAASLPTTFNSTQTWTNTPGGQAEVWTSEANPCPYGWHVPDMEEAKALLGVSGSTPFTGMDIEVNLGSVVDGLWFPNNGDRARKNGRLLSLGRRHFSWINALNGNSGYTVTVSSSTLNPAGSFNRGNATGVRCVRDFKQGSAKENGAIVWSEGGSLTGVVSRVSSIPMAGAKRLDADGTQPANCFVVSQPGIYAFAARSAGGSVPAGIPEDAVINLEVASVPGNAVVAYVDDEGKILWTWHIWASAAPLSEMEKAKGDVIMLDRLLGANSVTPGDPKANGLYFQWGRKDAFPGTNQLGAWADDKEAQSEEVLGGEATAVTTVNTELVSDWTVAEAEMPTSQAAASQPTVFNSIQTWTSTPGGQADTWTSEADPCPYGWHVPTQEEAQAMLGVTESTEFSGMDIEVNLGSVIDGLWFPNNGDRARKNGRLLSLGRRHFSWLNSLNGNSGYTITVSSSALNPAGSFNRGNATGVRCVKTK